MISGRRIGVVYFLVFVNLILLLVLVGLTAWVASLRADLTASKESARSACLRANVARDTIRFNTDTLAEIVIFVRDNATNQEIVDKFAQLAPELVKRSQQPLIQHQPCDALYPR